MNKYLILFLVAGMCLFSCSSDEDMMEEEIISPFAGTWSGPLIGNTTAAHSNGTINLTVRNDGSLTFRVTAQNGSVTSVVGEVTEAGRVTASAPETSTVKSDAKGTLRASTGNGTWTFEQSSLSIAGTWEVEKD